MGYSTGNTLLSAGGGRSYLSYSTAEINNSYHPTLTLTATPNPDNWGATGFSSSGSVGLSVTKSSFFTDLSYSGVYPNYSLSIYPIPENIGTVITDTVYPKIRDSAGIEGETSGGIPVNSISRNFTWTGISNFTTSGATDTASIFWSLLGNFHYTAFVDAANAITSQTFRGDWNTYPVGSCAQYNEAKVDFTGGSGGAFFIATQSGGSLTNNKTTGTYYTIGDNALNNEWGVRFVVAEGSSATANFNITLRNKANTSLTFTQAVSITFNN